MTKERPILFSAPMVRAILDGTKTQTRRLVKSPAKNMQRAGMQVIKHRAPGDPWYKDCVWSMRDKSGVWGDYTHDRFMSLCPYGEPGDRLWVREAFAPCAIYGAPVRIDAASYAVLADGTQVYRDPRQVFAGLAKYSPGAFDHIKWRPSIHMPRWASRLTLEVTSVRVERLHDISEDDARAEGVRPKDAHVVIECDAEGRARLNEALSNTHRGAFACLWDTINGGGAFASNPWVWVVIFKRVDA